MDTSSLSTGFAVDLPRWVLDELAGSPAVLSTHADRMRVVHALADRNHQEGTGGPFAALVVESATGTVVSAGVNVVLASGLSIAHAEVVALSLAQARIGGWDLGEPGAPERELVVNWRPCVQCYGAVVWSGVRRLVIAGEGPELEALSGFDEGPVREDWAAELERRGIEVVADVLREEAVAVFRSYGERADTAVYNARGAGRR